MTNNEELVEYYWDERSGFAEFLYENTYTGVTRVVQAQRSLSLPSPDPDSYFKNLVFWLNTQA